MCILAPSRCCRSRRRRRRCCCNDWSARMRFPATSVLVLLLLATALSSSTGATSFGVSVLGAECHARPSAALAHLSAREKSVVTLSTSCVASFSSIFSSRTPWWKAVIIDASEIRGMVPRTLVKREMKARSVSPVFCLTA